MMVRQVKLDEKVSWAGLSGHVKQAGLSEVTDKAPNRKRKEQAWAN